MRTRITPNWTKCATPGCTTEILEGEFCGDCMFGRAQKRPTQFDIEFSIESLMASLQLAKANMEQSKYALQAAMRTTHALVIGEPRITSEQYEVVAERGGAFYETVENLTNEINTTLKVFDAMIFHQLGAFQAREEHRLAKSKRKDAEDRLLAETTARQ